MTEKVLEKTFDMIMEHEGGSKVTNDPSDPGGLTKYGVSQRAYPNLDIKNLTKDDAMKIFKKDYWDKCKCDLLQDSISIIVADCAYNSGCSRAIKLLQKSLNINQDGIIGNQTLNSVKSFNEKELVDLYSKNRLDFLKSLSTFKRYGKGWTNRIEKTKKIALSFI